MKRYLKNHIHLKFLRFQSLLIGSIPMNLEDDIMHLAMLHRNDIFAIQSFTFCLQFVLKIPDFLG